MSAYLFEPTAPSTIPVFGSDKLYPVNRIFCVGRNYEAHAAEMGAVVDREAPFYFTKSPTNHPGKSLRKPLILLHNVRHEGTASDDRGQRTAPGC